jgi:hypothetical protein
MKKISNFLNEINTNVNVDASGIFGLLFQSRDIIHLNHLYTDSFSIHNILNEYYDGIIELIDELIESYQGLYGKIIIEIPPSKSGEHDSISNLENLNSILKKSINKPYKKINISKIKLKEKKPVVLEECVS